MLQENVFNYSKEGENKLYIFYNGVLLSDRILLMVCSNGHFNLSLFLRELKLKIEKKIFVK